MNTFIIFLLCFFLLKSGDITPAQEDNYATEEEEKATSSFLFSISCYFNNLFLFSLLIIIYQCNAA
ncbi:hypothetical protein Hanom_Chr04g00380381 [Helianthus anomalus]